MSFLRVLPTSGGFRMFYTIVHAVLAHFYKVVRFSRDASGTNFGRDFQNSCSVANVKIGFSATSEGFFAFLSAAGFLVPFLMTFWPTLKKNVGFDLGRKFDISNFFLRFWPESWF